jgi:hypothetical protein
MKVSKTVIILTLSILIFISCKKDSKIKLLVTVSTGIQSTNTPTQFYDVTGTNIKKLENLSGVQVFDITCNLGENISITVIAKQANTNLTMVVRKEDSFKPLIEKKWL